MIRDSRSEESFLIFVLGDIWKNKKFEGSTRSNVFLNREGGGGGPSELDTCPGTGRLTV